MKRVFFTILTLLLLPSWPLLAETPNFECKGQGFGSSKGKEILEKVQSEYGKVKSLKAKFSQDAFLSALEMSESSAGEVWFKKPGKMKWHYDTPEEQVFIINDTTLWLYQVAEKQVLIDQLSNVLLSDLPVSFLMGIGDLSKSFNLREVCDGNLGLILNLEPKTVDPSSERGLQAFALLVDRTSYIPLGAKVLDVAGNVTAITLSDFQANQDFAESSFVAKFPSGVDINDRRKAAVG